MSVLVRGVPSRVVGVLDGRGSDYKLVRVVDMLGAVGTSRGCSWGLNRLAWCFTAHSSLMDQGIDAAHISGAVAPRRCCGSLAVLRCCGSSAVLWLLGGPWREGTEAALGLL